MSLSGATRALGSSIIEGSYLEAGWAAPRRRSLVYRLTDAWQRLRRACRAPQMRIAGGTERGRSGRSYGLADGLQAVENRGVRTVNAGLCATASPSVGPGEANFFPYLSIQLPPVGDHLLGWGSLAFVWLGKCGR